MLPHKSKKLPHTIELKGYKALVIATSWGTLDRINPEDGSVIKVGKRTGVYASELTEPYYAFLDAGMEVTVASIQGGDIPIEKLSMFPFVRTETDKRYLADSTFKDKVHNSTAINDININAFDLVFIAGGWGASYDLAQSEVLAKKVSQAYANKKVLGAVCHGPLGLVSAHKPDGSPLLQDVKVTGVTNKQLKELMVGDTPKHPETELKKVNALYSCNTGILDLFNSHVVVDIDHLIVTGQNQKSSLEAAVRAMELVKAKG
jgi:putative intracellular protease/amidase